MALKTFMAAAALTALLTVLMLRRRDRVLPARPAAGRAGDTLRQAALDASRHEPANTMSPAACEMDGLLVGGTDMVPGAEPDSRRMPSIGAL